LRQKKGERWRNLIKIARSNYNGMLTYSASWGGEETAITWWNELDYISIDAYYPLIPFDPSPSIEDLVEEWDGVINKGAFDMKMGLQGLSEHWNKSIFFSEVGYCSGQCPVGESVNLQYQENHYAAVFEAFKDEPWFSGVFWWNWLSDPSFGGEYNYCYTLQSKPTEKMVRRWYGGLGDSQLPAGGPVCSCEDHMR